ncbi:hypothetical protein FAM09_29625 [Niastella caeni]|uniref:DUF5977 domain-containing protein n=1 Tax=Niastella caeni TaxID=2569763 RepID=A0A4S8HDV3_9BACT|nr:DUF5977 domain-containing protein [Niastella caeni]THU30762.1 hypothetical protein FAM09_29625 [Niastella caeni]
MIPCKRILLQFAALMLMCVMAHAAGDHKKADAPMAIKFAGYIFNATQTVTLGATPAMLEASEALGSCSGGFLYQWQQSTDGINFTNISGATGLNYQPGAITQKMYYRRMVYCGEETAYTNIATISVQLDGGCISSKIQFLLFGSIPATIVASAANYGSDPANYKYQWQTSTDNIAFTNITGAVSQNLSFSSPLSQTSWFQRKTTSGTTTVTTSTSVKVVMASTLYYNVVKSGSFTRNNCGGGASGTTVTYTVAANTYVTDISQADADAQAQNDVNANGQNYANTNGQCYWSSVAKSGTFTKNNCASGGTGSQVTYNVEAGAYTSTISQADADAQAQNEVNANGQTYANNNGYCTWYSVAKWGSFTRNNCGSGYTGSSVTYTVPANAYTSTISQADADQKAQNDVNNNGQTYANNNGTCQSSTVNVNATNWTSAYFTASFTNTATNTTYNFSITPGMNGNYRGQMPAGTYNVNIYPSGGSALYEWWVGNYYSAGQNTFTVSGLSFNWDFDISIADY